METFSNFETFCNFFVIGGLQPISRDTDSDAAIYNGRRTKGANDKSFVFLHQYGDYDVT